MAKSRETIKYSPVTIACAVMLVIAVAAYLYFLNMSVVQVVMRTEAAQDRYLLNAEIALLESDYIVAQHEIASRIATNMDFDNDMEKIFVSAGSNKVVLGME